MSLGAQFITAILESKSEKTLLQLNPKPSLFLPSEAATFTALTKHVEKYGEIPSVKALSASCNTPPSIVDPNDAPDSPEYYYDLIVERYISRVLQKALVSTTAILQDGGVDGPSKAHHKLLETLIETGDLLHRNVITDIRDTAESFMAEYRRKWAVQEGAIEKQGLLFGWPALDSGTIGLSAGDVVSYVGRPAIGKTWMLVYTAYHAWWIQKKAVAFVTCEMAPNLILDRVAALNTKLPHHAIRHGTLLGDGIRKLSKGVHGFTHHGTPFYIIDGNLAPPVHEIKQICMALKIDALFIDGAYMLGHSDVRLNKASRVAENVELIKKQLSVGLGIPCSCTFQFNRDAVSKPKSGPPGLENIAHSDAIGQFSSVVLGFLEDENIETLVGRRVYILKDRYNIPREFSIKWDLDSMNFDEVDSYTIKATPLDYL